MNKRDAIGWEVRVGERPTGGCLNNPRITAPRDYLIGAGQPLSTMNWTTAALRDLSRRPLRSAPL